MSKGGFGRDESKAPPAGFDYCAAPAVGKAQALARDSGNGSYAPIAISEGITWLGIHVPIYRGGAVPATLEARRDAFVGWLGMFLSPDLVLDRALQGHPDMAVSLRYDLNSSKVEFSSGTMPDGATSVSIDLHNGWTVSTFGVVVGDGGCWWPSPTG